MGCGNSSPVTKNMSANINSSIGHTELSTTETNDLSDDDKRQNYGGVYVGLSTAEQSNCPHIQIGALRESNGEPSSLMKPLWGNGLKF